MLLLSILRGDSKIIPALENCRLLWLIVCWTCFPILQSCYFLPLYVIMGLACVAWVILRFPLQNFLNRFCFASLNLLYAISAFLGLSQFPVCFAQLSSFPIFVSILARFMFHQDTFLYSVTASAGQLVSYGSLTTLLKFLKTNPSSSRFWYHRPSLHE